MRNEERRNGAEVRRRNLLVMPIEIEDDHQVRRQKLQDIGKNFISDLYIHIYIHIYKFEIKFIYIYIFVSLSVLYLVPNDTNDTDQHYYSI